MKVEVISSAVLSLMMIVEISAQGMVDIISAYLSILLLFLI